MLLAQTSLGQSLKTPIQEDEWKRLAGP